MVKRILIFVSIFILCVTSYSQPIQKIKIKNADPALIIMILMNQTTLLTPPEMSAIFPVNQGFGGGGFGGGSNPGGFGQGGFGGWRR